jgi:hypothetical protein
MTIKTTIKAGMTKAELINAVAGAKSVSTLK